MYIISTQAILWYEVFKSYNLISKALLCGRSNTSYDSKSDDKNHKQRNRGKGTVDYHACTLPIDSSGTHEILAQYLALDMTLRTPTCRVLMELSYIIDETGDGWPGNVGASLCNSCLTMLM